MNIFNKKKLVTNSATLFLVTIMVLAAEIFGNKEIIFPEITALAVGYILSEKRSWNVDDKRMLLLIAVCACMGVVIVRYVRIGVFPELMLAFVFAQIVFCISGTSFAPLISAVVLPVMLQTESIVYPIAAVILTIAVIVCRRFLIHFGIREDEEYIPKRLNSASDIKDTVKRIVLVVLIGYAAFRFDFRFVIAPPLLVAFTELSRPGNKAKKKPFKIIAAMTAAAFVAAVFRYFITIKGGMPLTLTAATASLAMLIIINLSSVYLPPLGAVTLLAMLIPEAAVITYPLQIAVGISIYILLARTVFAGSGNIKDQ
ncbi:MAG: hypothetical protein K5894_03490 [Lachnospiraceae bacterium]|nr:hypothetical protein [Lachnospiraceae bacterium]